MVTLKDSLKTQKRNHLRNSIAATTNLSFSPNIEPVNSPSFKVVSREKWSSTFDKTRQSPAVGSYHPRFTTLHKHAARAIISKSKDYSSYRDNTRNQEVCRSLLKVYQNSDFSELTLSPKQHVPAIKFSRQLKRKHFTAVLVKKSQRAATKRATTKEREEEVVAERCYKK